MGHAVVLTRVPVVLLDLSFGFLPVLETKFELHLVDVTFAEISTVLDEFVEVTVSDFLIDESLGLFSRFLILSLRLSFCGLFSLRWFLLFRLLRCWLLGSRSFLLRSGGLLLGCWGLLLGCWSFFCGSWGLFGWLGGSRCLSGFRLLSRRRLGSRLRLFSGGLSCRLFLGGDFLGRGGSRRSRGCSWSRWPLSRGLEISGRFQFLFCSSNLLLGPATDRGRHEVDLLVHVCGLKLVVVGVVITAVGVSVLVVLAWLMLVMLAVPGFVMGSLVVRRYTTFIIMFEPLWVAVVITIVRAARVKSAVLGLDVAMLYQIRLVSVCMSVDVMLTSPWLMMFRAHPLEGACLVELVFAIDVLMVVGSIAVVAMVETGVVQGRHLDVSGAHVVTTVSLRAVVLVFVIVSRSIRCVRVFTHVLKTAPVFTILVTMLVEVLSLGDSGRHQQGK